REVEEPASSVLLFHDFEGVPDLPPLVRSMLAERCRDAKIAVTPHTLEEDEDVLAAIQPGGTMIGMGDGGLYSRILAPFFGSEFFFAGNAAPGQIPLERALLIYGDRKLPDPERVFAI